MERIGRAYGRDRNGRRDTYAVHRVVRGHMLTVSHTGYVDADGSQTGLPLGGPGWTPPNYVDVPMTAFSEINLRDVEIRKCEWHTTPSGRPRTNEYVLVRRRNGDSVRYEFDYDERHVYVYTSIWPASRTPGTGPADYLPVRAFPRNV